MFSRFLRNRLENSVADELAPPVTPGEPRRSEGTETCGKTDHETGCAAGRNCIVRVRAHGGGSDAAGASLVQPITLAWSAVVDPDWPIGSYMWPVSSTSTFDIIIASGATNSTGDPIPSRETLQAFSNFLPAAPDRTNITTLCDIQQN